MHNAETSRPVRGARRTPEKTVSRAENQISFLRRTKLRAVPPVNKQAVAVLYAIESCIRSAGLKWRVAFEVGMGAFIQPVDDPKGRIQKAAFGSYNSKRVDFLLIDRVGNPILAVEYHGTGHNMSPDAPDRMKVKRLALDQAGIPLLEIPAGTTKADILRLIEDKLASTASQMP